MSLKPFSRPAGTCEANPQQEVPQYLRMLRDYGGYAVSGLVLENPFFQKLSQGELGHRDRQVLQEQSVFLESHLFELLKAGIEEAIRGRSGKLAGVLQRIALYQFSNHKKTDVVVQPSTLRFLGVVNEMTGERNYVRIAAAVYGLMRMASAERLLLPPPADSATVRETVRDRIRSNGSLQSGNGKAGARPLHGVAEIIKMSPGLAEKIETDLIAGMEEALTEYVSGRHTFRNGIVKGIEIMVDAKKLFYSGLAEDLREETPATSQELHILPQQS